MSILGAHISIAGGVHQAVERASERGLDCLQIFTKSRNQWKARTLEEKEIEAFKQGLVDHNLSHPLVHDSYLINVASPKESLYEKSLEALEVELQRTAMLEIPWLVIHPGSYTSGSEEEGLARVIRAVNRVLKNVKGTSSGILLETTAGQGTSLGWKFEQLAWLLQRCDVPERIGVCFDTCHVFAAGYPFASAKEYHDTMKELDEVIGLEHLRAFHLNGSKSELGSRVDRHDHIGEGHLKLEAFGHLLSDRRFKRIPMYMETPKEIIKNENGEEEDSDALNLRRLRRVSK